MNGNQQSRNGNRLLLGLLIWRVSVCSAGAAAGDLDPSFSPVVDGDVASAAVDASSGKIVIGGSFISVNGTSRYYLARLNADGSLDLSFDPGNYPGRPVRQVLLSGSKVLANVGDTVVRLRSDGSRDLPTTNVPPPYPNGWSEPLLEFGGGYHIEVIVPFYSTGFYIGGDFLTLWDHASSTFKASRTIARLKADGKLDTTFVPAIGDSFWPQAYDLAVSGSKLLVAGYLQASNGYWGLFRLNFNGTVDTSFSMDYRTIWSGNRVLAQPDGKILFAGLGSFMVGNSSFFWRLNADGSHDETFHPSGSSSCPGYGFSSPILLQPNGRIVTQFMTNGPGYPSLSCALDSGVRLNADGSLDPTFHRALFKALASQPDGKILVSGYSDPATGTTNSFARLIGRSDWRFESIGRLTNGTVRMRLSGEPGEGCAIEGSTDVTQWVRLATNSSTVGLWDSVDSSATNFAQRFYRLVTFP